MQIDLVAPGGISGGGVMTVDLSSFWFKYAVDFSLSDIVGLHNAGVGGGGQGFGSSYPGKFLNTSKRPLEQEGYGSLSQNGLGSKSSVKLSAGAAGGIVGLDGANGITIDFDDFFQPSSAIDGNKTTAKNGGAAGRAIDATGNTNYTKANFRTKLCRIKGAENQEITSFSDIQGLVAHFDAAQNVYEDAAGTDAAEDGDLVKRWSSVNDATNIYMVQNNALEGAPTYQSNSASIPAKYFRGDKCILFDTNIGGGLDLPGIAPSLTYLTDKRLKIVGITGTNKIENDMKGFDIFYCLYPLGDEFQLWWGHSYYFTRYLHAWSPTVVEGEYSRYSLTAATDSVFPNGGGDVADNTGLGTANVVARNEAMSHPKNAGYVWNISGNRMGEFATLALRRGEITVSTVIRQSTGFSFFDQPVIGGRGNEWPDEKNMMTNPQWWGGIAQLVVFNRHLTIEERSAVNNLLMQKELKVKATTAAQISSYQAANPFMKNTEPFRNRSIDGHNFAGFCVFDS